MREISQGLPNKQKIPLLLGKFVLPDIVKQGFLYSIAGWDVYFGEIAIATVALAIFAYLKIRGASLSGKTQFVFCVFLIIGVILISVGMIFNPVTSFSNVQPLFKLGVST
jgi:amino acid transporter